MLPESFFEEGNRELFWPFDIPSYFRNRERERRERTEFSVKRSSSRMRYLSSRFPPEKRNAPRDRNSVTSNRCLFSVRVPVPGAEFRDRNSRIIVIARR